MCVSRSVWYIGGNLTIFISGDLLQTVDRSTPSNTDELVKRLHHRLPVGKQIESENFPFLSLMLMCVFHSSSWSRWGGTSRPSVGQVGRPLSPLVHTSPDLGERLTTRSSSSARPITRTQLQLLFYSNSSPNYIAAMRLWCVCLMVMAPLVAVTVPGTVHPHFSF